MTFHFVCPDGPPKTPIDCANCETSHRYPRGCHFVLTPDDLPQYPLLHQHPQFFQAHSAYQGPSALFAWAHPETQIATDTWLPFKNEWQRHLEEKGGSPNLQRVYLRRITHCTYHPDTAPSVYVSNYHAQKLFVETVHQHFRRIVDFQYGHRWEPILRRHNTMTQLWTPNQ